MPVLTYSLDSEQFCCIELSFLTSVEPAIWYQSKAMDLNENLHSTQR